MNEALVPARVWPARSCPSIVVAAWLLLIILGSACRRASMATTSSFRARYSYQLRSGTKAQAQSQATQEQDAHRHGDEEAHPRDTGASAAGPLRQGDRDALAASLSAPRPLSPLLSPHHHHQQPATMPEKVQPRTAGDAEGYTLEFASFADFKAWRAQEEAAHDVQFAKGESHGSKDHPPSFKDHMTFNCAFGATNVRQTYSGRNPGSRQRKTSQRKVCHKFLSIDNVLNGIQASQTEESPCPASMCVKTFYNNDIVRVKCKHICALDSAHINSSFFHRRQ